MDLFEDEFLLAHSNEMSLFIFRDGQLFALETIKCQFLYAAVVITPLDQGSNQVEILCKPELTEPLGHVKVQLFA